MTSTDRSYYTILVTGANSGIGLAICKRLIDEFLHTRPTTQSLYLIPTTRSHSKATDTIKALHQHVQLAVRDHARARKLIGDLDALTSLETEFEERIQIKPQLLDLCNLLSVKEAAKDLRRSLPGGRLDVLIANAGIGGWTGLDWGILIRQFLFSPAAAVSFPEYKIASVGRVTARQVPVKQGEGKEDSDLKSGKEDVGAEEALGEVFTANVFGHYMLMHWLMACLKKSRGDGEGGVVRQDPGRIIWLGSAQAPNSSLDPMNDLQGMKSPVAYESSKRLTDLLVLTSEDEETSEYTTSFYGSSGSAAGDSSTHSPNPKMYVAHPGYCVTTIFAIPLFMIIGQYMLFYLARLCGSVWHTIQTYPAATSMVWLALTEQSTLDKQEARDGKSKWGSAVGRFGGERSLRTEVEGWGFGGIPGEKGPKIGLLTNEIVTKDGVRKFQGEGVKVWREMEGLRVRWEKYLEEVDEDEE